MDTVDTDEATARAVLWALAFGDKYKVGDKVRTIASAAPGADIVRNVSGDHFISTPSWQSWWYGWVRQINPSREDSILVSHNHKTADGDFIAWYKPDDVIEGW